MVNKNVLLLCSFFLLWVGLEAQQADNKLWVNFALKVPVSEKFSYGGDAGFRQILSEGNWKQFLIRPSVTYRMDPVFALGGALAYFKTYSGNAANLNEFRIHQEANMNWPDFGFARLSFRLRLEERFFVYQDLPDNFSLRIRFLAQARTRDLTFLGDRRPVYFKFIFEGFEALNQKDALEFFVDNTRMHLAFGHRLSPAWRYEFHYIRQQSRLVSTGSLTLDQNIFRLRVFYTLFEKDSKIPEMVDPEIE
jgi:hypothetical protein